MHHLLRTTSTSLLGATLLGTAAAAQDPRLERLDPRVRPLVASVIDSARAAGADLVASGVPVDSAAAAVLALATTTRDADLVEFRRAVERDIALGAPPGMAVSTAATAAYGATGAGVQLDAGARQARPSRP